MNAWEELRKPFPPEQIGKLPATNKRPALDYVGHAAVTDRLNKHVPDWTYTIDAEKAIGEAYWIRGTLTIDGVSRVEYGDGANPKEAIGNFIRRAAMRFGVAIDLWSREELESAPPLGEVDGAEVGEDREARRPPASSPTPTYPVDQATCTHKTASGRWVTFNAEGLCPKCGMDAISAVEGTTADLGPA